MENTNGKISTGNLEEEVYSVDFKAGVYESVKRAFDMIISLVGLVVLSPVFLILIAVVKFDSRKSDRSHVVL